MSNNKKDKIHTRIYDKDGIIIIDEIWVVQF